MRLRAWWIGLLVCALGVAACTPQPVREKDSQATRAAEINVQLGLVYMNQGDNERALEKLERALYQDSGYAPAHAAIALLYDRLGEIKQADTHHHRAVTLDPKDSGARNNYGAFLCRQGRLADADEQFTAAVQNPLYSTPEFAYTNAGICARRVPDAEKAERYFRQALQINPKFPDALFQMSQLSLEQQEYLQARAYLQRYLEVARQTPASLWVGIQVERALGDKNAVASYALLLKGNFPDSEETRLLLESERHEQGARH